MHGLHIDLKGDELHTKLGGALPLSSFVLIEAPNAVGKSVLAQRFAWGAAANNHTVTYVTTELGTVGFMRQMLSLQYDIRPQILNNTFKIVSLFPSMGAVHFSDNLIRRLLDKTALFSSDLVVIDTISELLVRSDMELHQCYNLLLELRRMVSGRRTIVLCVDPHTLGGKLLDLLRSVSDVYLRLEVREQFGSYIKVLRVERFSGAPGEVSAEIPFKVKAGLGIVPELASTS